MLSIIFGTLTVIYVIFKVILIPISNQTVGEAVNEGLKSAKGIRAEIDKILSEPPKTKYDEPDILAYEQDEDSSDIYDEYNPFDQDTKSILREQGIEYLQHMTHINNLQGILDHGLLAHNNSYKKTDISNLDVNERRRTAEPIYGRSIHGYVPFYFNPRNAMLYRNQKVFGNNIVILGFSKKLVFDDEVVFTEGNASTSRTQFFHDMNELNDTINWEYVWSNSWNGKPNGNEIKRTMMAEVLVYNKVKSKKLKVIYCQNKGMKDYLKDNYYLANIEVEVNKNLFF